MAYPDVHSRQEPIYMVSCSRLGWFTLVATKDYREYSQDDTWALMD